MRSATASSIGGAAKSACPRWRTATRIAAFARPHATLLLVFVAALLADAGLGVATPLVFRSIVNSAIATHSAHAVVTSAALIALIGVATAVIGVGQAALAATIGTSVTLSLRVKLFEHIQRMPMAFFGRVQVGALVSRLSTDVVGAQSAFTDILSRVVGNSVVALSLLVAMFVLSWKIAIMSLAVVPLLYVPTQFCGRKLQRLTRGGLDAVSAMNSFVADRFSVNGAQIAKVFGAPHADKEEFARRAEIISSIGVKSAIYGRLFVGMLTVVVACATAFAYGEGGLLVLRKQLDVGAVVTFAAYVSRLYGTVTGLSNINITIVTAIVSFERVLEILDLPLPIQDRADAKAIPDGPARVEVLGVSFHYPAANDIVVGSLAPPSEARPHPESGAALSDVTFVAEPGQMVALVGPSGGGKTTIARLILRLYDVSGGKITINGVDVRDASAQSLRQRVGAVTQDAHFFHGTIRTNLLYAEPNASDARLMEVLDAAQLLPLIRSLPAGVDTVIGEQGYRFSGGEKQRLAIARVLLRRPDVVILDEATAHLDSETERAIHQMLSVELRKHTFIVIAHRLSTILTADQIIIINDGRVLQRGTHAELLRSEGRYADLYYQQFVNARSKQKSENGQ